MEQLLTSNEQQTDEDNPELQIQVVVVVVAITQVAELHKAATEDLVLSLSDTNTI